MILQVAVTGVLGFGLCGALIWAFWRSLQREDAEGAVRFTRRSAILLVLVVVSLLAVSIVLASLS